MPDNGGQTALSAPVSLRRHVPSYEFMAATVGDLEWLRQSMLRLQDARTKKTKITYDKNGLTPLHLAAESGHLDCIKLLVHQFGFSVNVAGRNGWRPVHLCISQNAGKSAVDCLQYLLSIGADPSRATADGVTPVHQAAKEGNVQCLKVLVNAGAKVDGLNSDGQTAYDLARIYGHKECARLISTAKWHQTKDQEAIENRNSEITNMKQSLDELSLQAELVRERDDYAEQAFRKWLGEHPLSGSSAVVQHDERGKDQSKYEAPECTKMKNTQPKHSVLDIAAKRPQIRGSRIELNMYKIPQVTPVPRLHFAEAKPGYAKLPVAVLQRCRSTPSKAMQLAISNHRLVRKNLMSDSLTYRELKTMTEDVLSLRSASASVVLEPHTITDVEKKRHYSADVVPRGEVPLHILSDDPSSWLFRNALLPNL